MTLRHLPSMLKLSTIKWKRHKSSRYLPEFNATSNKLLSEHRASLKAKEAGAGK